MAEISSTVVSHAVEIPELQREIDRATVRVESHDGKRTLYVLGSPIITVSEGAITIHGPKAFTVKVAGPLDDLAALFVAPPATEEAEPAATNGSRQHRPRTAAREARGRRLNDPALRALIRRCRADGCRTIGAVWTRLHVREGRPVRTSTTRTRGPLCAQPSC